MACWWFNVENALVQKAKYEEELSKCEQIIDVLSNLQVSSGECSSNLRCCSDEISNILLSGEPYDKNGKISTASSYINSWSSKISTSVSAVNKRMNALEEKIQDLNSKIQKCEE